MCICRCVHSIEERADLGQDCCVRASQLCSSLPLSLREFISIDPWSLLQNAFVQAGSGKGFKGLCRDH